MKISDSIVISLGVKEGGVLEKVIGSQLEYI